MIRSATGEVSRRGDLLKLARWFDASDDATAHDLFVAAFSLYGARHLGVAPSDDGELPATTSWWVGPVAPVPIALRERGSRAPRGRPASAEDYAAQRERLRKEAAEVAERQLAAVESPPQPVPARPCGIRQVWQYDDEFSFGDGRLLLRGKNGAGKSKALEILLPFLLDGDTRKIDASGGGKTSLKWLMLDGWAAGTNRLGYLWAELTRVDDEGPVAS